MASVRRLLGPGVSAVLTGALLVTAATPAHASSVVKVSNWSALVAAFATASPGNDVTVQLITAVSNGGLGTALAVPAGSSVTLDLNGLHLTANMLVGAQSVAGIGVPTGTSLTIEDTSAFGQGQLDAQGQSGGPAVGVQPATGGGAGIGSAGTVNAGNVTITGGTIRAIGGGGSGSYGDGAGIGGGGGHSAGSLTVAGGNITATGGNGSFSGAGIGGGGDGAAGGGTVLVTGGTVTATGGHGFYAGDGIGAGDGGHGPTMTVTGGTVSATGGAGSVVSGAGVGGDLGQGTLAVATPGVVVDHGPGSAAGGFHAEAPRTDFALSASASPVQVGEPLTFTESVSSPSAGCSTGTVVFDSDGVAIPGTVSADPVGTQTTYSLSTSALLVGGHLITVGFTPGSPSCPVLPVEQTADVASVFVLPGSAPIVVGDWPRLVADVAGVPSGYSVTMQLGAAISNTTTDQLAVNPGATVTIDLDSNNLTINPGNVPAGDAGIGVPVGASLIIEDSGEGGTLVVTGAGGGAGIGGGGGADAPSGGAVGAAGGAGTSAGSVTVTGGSVTATGSRGGAGIGGGGGGAGGDSVGGASPTVGGPGGAGGAAGSVSVTGGSVSATGLGGGAGIGGGAGGQRGSGNQGGGNGVPGAAGGGGSVSIADGSVTATGGAGASAGGGGAGIGGGGGASGPSVGGVGGAGGSGAAVTVTGGSVIASGGGGAGGASGDGDAIGGGGHGNGAGAGADGGFGSLDDSGSVTFDSAEVIPSSVGYKEAPSPWYLSNELGGTVVVAGGSLSGGGKIDNLGVISTSGSGSISDLLRASSLTVRTDAFALSFDANGGTWSGDAPGADYVYADRLIDAGSAFPDGPSKPGYTFTGWNTAPNGGGTAVAATTDLVATFGAGPESETLYAQYAVGPPRVTGVSPDVGPIAGGTQVTIAGTGFSGTTKVTFGATKAAAVTVVSDTEIVATSPMGTGNTHVRVTTPRGPSTIGSADLYRYVAAPAVTGVERSSGATAGGTSVTIAGTGFSGASAVSFGSTPAAGFTVVSAAKIRATTPPHAAGAVDVIVTGVGGTGSASPADEFQYLSPPAVSAISPSVGPSAGGTVVIITGSGFSRAAKVFFGVNTATAVTVNSDTSITATSPAGSGHAHVRVNTPVGTSPAVTADLFRYGTPPAVTSISPASGPNAGGTAVTISGSGFTGATKVLFGQTAAARFTVNSDSSVTVTAPAGVGRGHVRVTTVIGTSPAVTVDLFRYTG